MIKPIIIIILLLLLIGIGDYIMAKEIIIPEDAIRLRVIANSNTPYDQYIKTKIRDRLQIEVYNLLKDVDTIDEARKIITSHLNKLDAIVGEVIKEEKYNMDYVLVYGDNYFPAKDYKGIKYNAGFYESLLITIGKGKGENWWCVLFPPLCLIEAENADDVEYKFFVKEIIDRFLKR